MPPPSVLVVILPGLLVGLAGCARNPVTGERQLSLVSEAQEVQLGREAARQVEQSLGLVEDAALQAYVQRIGLELAKRSERPNLPWTFKIVDDPVPNAFALPGGPIFLTRGLLALMDSEAELASVLGHEIGHVTARHSVTQISRQQLAQLGLGLGGVLIPEIEPYQQALGFDYARTLGYDLREMADVFEALQRYGRREEQGAVLPSWLATHPAPPERIEAVRQRVDAIDLRSSEPRLGRAEYLGQIDGLVYGANPRHGFFRGTVFNHPELQFRLEVPAGWETANLPQAVVASSPQGNAIAQLTLAGQATPAQAARAFTSQAGVRVLDTSQQAINGLPAVVTTFEARTRQGVVAGSVAHLAHRGRIFQILTYAAAAAFREARPIFAGIVGSFAPLTDRALLDVQPRRIDVVPLSRDLSIAEFERAFPSSVPLDVLAILNQVPAPSATLESGTLAKRIVGPAVATPDR